MLINLGKVGHAPYRTTMSVPATRADQSPSLVSTRPAGRKLTLLVHITTENLSKRITRNGTTPVRGFVWAFPLVES